MAANKYQTRVYLASGLALAASVAAGIVAGRLVRMGEPGENFWLVFPALLVVCALAFAACIPWWRRVDDMHKSGHLVSWYWGGTGGAAVALMAIIAATGVHSDMSTGALFLLIGQVVAFLLTYLVWWLRRRGPAA